MLASIHPLGERARNRRWGITVTAYVLGSVAGAALLGALLGLLGSAIVPDGWPGGSTAAVVVAAICGIGLALDLGLGGLRIPTIHRQVDERWLDRYRGWVYGLGFGFQLGLGVVTVVTTATIYLTFALAFLSGSAGAGLLIGVVFGAVRALPVLAVAWVRRPQQLHQVHRRIHALAPMSHRLTVAVQAAVAVAAPAVILR